MHLLSAPSCSPLIYLTTSSSSLAVHSGVHAKCKVLSGLLAMFFMSRSSPSRYPHRFFVYIYIAALYSMELFQHQHMRPSGFCLDCVYAQVNFMQIRHSSLSPLPLPLISCSLTICDLSSLSLSPLISHYQHSHVSHEYRCDRPCCPTTSPDGVDGVQRASSAAPGRGRRALQARSASDGERGCTGCEYMFLLLCYCVAEE
jgi:hypothetical protein